MTFLKCSPPMILAYFMLFINTYKFREGEQTLPLQFQDIREALVLLDGHAGPGQTQFLHVFGRDLEDAVDIYGNASKDRCILLASVLFHLDNMLHELVNERKWLKPDRNRMLYDHFQASTGFVIEGHLRAALRTLPKGLDRTATEDLKEINLER
jgi:hypothetical protein